MQNESQTAKICALSRSYHVKKSSIKIFSDPLAGDLCNDCANLSKCVKRFVHDENYQNFEELLDKLVSPITLSRAAYTEKRLLNFKYQHPLIQYVICGAGLDTFAFRNVQKNIEIFEVDHPLTQQSKQEKIRQLNWQTPKNLHWVPVNFQTEHVSERLLKQGFSKEVPTFVSILGVSYYLSFAELSQTVQDIRKVLSPESEIVLDYPDRLFFKKQGSSRECILRNLTCDLGEKMNSGFSPQEIQHLFLTNGFITQEHLSQKEIDQRFFSNTPFLKAFEHIHFLSASTI